MRRHTIAKTLALFLGVLSVVAHSLPERQSEIDVSSPVLDGNIHTATSSMPNNTTFPKRDDYTCTLICQASGGDNPIPGDCAALANSIASKPGEFVMFPGKSPSLPQDYDTDAWDRGSLV